MLNTPVFLTLHCLPRDFFLTQSLPPASIITSAEDYQRMASI
jgi:hypothetical protein